MPAGRAPAPPRLTPMPSVRRLPGYLRLLWRFRDDGDERVSCTRIAGDLGLDATQVRKDLSITGVAGRPRIGYRVDDLIAAITVFLDWDRRTEALLVGAGNLGRALLGYEPFRSCGLEVVMAFDNDPARVGQTFFGKPVYAMGELAARVAERGIRVGILTVPGPAAESVAEALAAAGVTGVWNFTPARVGAPSGVLVEQVDLLSSWAGLSARLAAR